MFLRSLVQKTNMKCPVVTLKNLRPGPCLTCNAFFQPFRNMTNLATLSSTSRGEYLKTDVIDLHNLFCVLSSQILLCFANSNNCFFNWLSIIATVWLCKTIAVYIDIR